MFCISVAAKILNYTLRNKLISLLELLPNTGLSLLEIMHVSEEPRLTLTRGYDSDG